MRTLVRPSSPPKLLAQLAVLVLLTLTAVAFAAAETPVPQPLDAAALSIPA